jgi:hypothetical protein
MCGAIVGALAVAVFGVGLLTMVFVTAQAHNPQVRWQDAKIGEMVFGGILLPMTWGAFTGAISGLYVARGRSAVSKASSEGVISLTGQVALVTGGGPGYRPADSAHQAPRTRPPPHAFSRSQRRRPGVSRACRLTRAITALHRNARDRRAGTLLTTESHPVPAPGLPTTVNPHTSRLAVRVNSN